MNRLEQYQNLIASHAYWAGEVKKLKEEGSKEFNLCETSGPQTNYENCIGKVFKKWKPELSLIQTSYDDFINFISFEEFYSESVANGEVCEHCQRLRELKDKRSFASKRLGQVRSAITRIGNKLNSDNAKA